MDVLADLPVPRPVKGGVDAVVAFVPSHAVEPPFVEVLTSSSVGGVARALIDAGAMTEREMHAWLRDRYETSLARSAFPSLQRFVEAVQQEVLILLASAPGTVDPEAPTTPAERASELPPLRRGPTRPPEPVYGRSLRRVVDCSPRQGSGIAWP